MSNHSFDIHVATEYKSTDIAILIWHFHYWIMKNKRMNRNQIEGRTWTYQTYEEITSAFPYWSRDQIKRLLKKAIELKILIKNNFNSHKYDQTMWYAFENEEKFGISLFREMDKDEEDNDDSSGIGRNRPIEKAISPDEQGGIALPIPDTLPYTLTNKREEEAAPPAPTSLSKPKCKKKDNKPKVEKIAYRENVLLTQEQYKKLFDKYGKEKLEWMLDYLSVKKFSNGLPYDSDYHVLLENNWVNQEYEKQKKSGVIINTINPNNLNENGNKIKRLCAAIEELLSPRKTTTLFFESHPTEAILFHQKKDIKNTYRYEGDFETVRSQLYRDLEISFPGSYEMFSKRSADANKSKIG